MKQFYKLFSNTKYISLIHCLFIAYSINLESTGLLAVSVGEETVIKKTSSSSNADDIIMLEIDIKEPVKRSPVSSVYGTSGSQFIVRHGDDSQEVMKWRYCIHYILERHD
jgi:hypothetical protein